ncbi:MAG: regulatory protein RecX [Pseudobdellovibrionaceae bacterium]
MCRTAKKKVLALHLCYNPGMSQAAQPPYSHKLYAKKKVMDLVALRDHSEKELRTKLRTYFKRNFQYRQRLAKKQGRDLSEEFASQQEEINDAIEGAIEFAKSHQWICKPEDLAEKMATMLHRKKKGISYINNYLKEKGLPSVPQDRDLELEKALALVKNKYSDFSQLSFEEKKKEQARVGRFLVSRGFDSETVRKVIYEKL